jgi:hypothetical protein
LEFYLIRGEQDIKGIKGALNKLRKLIWSHINMYATDRVFARILLLEVRNYPDYFKSDAYQMVQRYSKLMMNIIEEGVASGEIRGNVRPSVIRRLILGAIEHVCLPGVIFNLEIDPEPLTEELAELIFTGIAAQR